MSSFERVCFIVIGAGLVVLAASTCALLLVPEL